MSIYTVQYSIEKGKREERGEKREERGEMRREGGWGEMKETEYRI